MEILKLTETEQAGAIREENYRELNMMINKEKIKEHRQLTMLLLIM